MSDLHIDGDSLRGAALLVRGVVDTFATAGSDAHDAATYVGHAGLARRVREFADGWDIHRGKFSNELWQLADALEAVDDTFTDLDYYAAGQLRQAAAMVAAGGTSGHTNRDPVASLAGGEDS